MITIKQYEVKLQKSKATKVILPQNAQILKVEFDPYSKEKILIISAKVDTKADDIVAYFYAFVLDDNISKTIETRDKDKELVYCGFAFPYYIFWAKSRINNGYTITTYNGGGNMLLNSSNRYAALNDYTVSCCNTSVCIDGEKVEK